MANQNTLALGHNSAQPQTFNFDNLPVRTVERDGAIWFVADDVCKVLEHTNPSTAISRLDEDEVNTLNISEGIQGNPNVNIISESGLYALVMTSRKPEVKRFKKWVTSEVLPQIRKTGSYSAQSEAEPKKIDHRGRPPKLHSPNYKLASELAAQAAQAVFEAVNHTGFNWQRNRRLLLTLNNGKPTFKPLEPDAFITSPEKLPQAIAQGGGYTSQKQLVDLIQACLDQIAKYWLHKE